MGPEPSYFLVFGFVLVLTPSILASVFGDGSFSFKEIGKFFDDSGLAVFVGLIGIYVTRQK
jgi:hypothetical protein